MIEISQTASRLSHTPLFVVGAGAGQMKEYTKLFKEKFPNIHTIAQVFRSYKPALEEIGARIFHMNDVSGLGEVKGLKEWFASKNCSKAIVVLPHHLHSQAVRTLSAMGIREIFKDKPLAATEEELVEVIELKRQGVDIFTLTQREFSLANRDALKALDKIGEIRSFQYTYEGNFPKTSGWRADPKQALGGVSLDMGAHLLQVVAMFFEGVPKITAETSYHYSEMAEKGLEDRLDAILTYPTFQGKVVIDRCATKKSEVFFIQGSMGTMTITPNGYSIQDCQGQVVEEKNSFLAGVNSKQLTQEIMFEKLLSDPVLRQENWDTNLRAVKMYLQIREAHLASLGELTGKY